MVLAISLAGNQKALSYGLFNITTGREGLYNLDISERKELVLSKKSQRDSNKQFIIASRLTSNLSRLLFKCTG
jgi:hypothetical protein